MEQPLSPGADDKRDMPPGWMIASSVLGGIGLLAVLIYAAQIPPGRRWAAFATAVAVAGAAAFLGGLVGFVFGVPRTIPAPRSPGNESRYQDNSNLEQVSDWLSKIIVGVGLVQIGRLLPALGRLGRSLRVPLGGLPSSSAFGLALTLAYAALGFLFTYLWTRERLLPQLDAARRSLEAARDTIVSDVVEQAVPAAVQQAVPAAVQQAVPRAVQAAAASMDDRERTEFDALFYARRQLDSGKGGSAPAPEQLAEVFGRCPHSTLLQVYFEAEDIRARNWVNHDQEDPAPEDEARRLERLALTIPVFEALVAADTAREYHRFPGSLGFALKDREQPDHLRAWQQLTAAIQVRDAHGQEGWRIYEACRALCAIRSLDHPQPGWPPPDRVIAGIRADLAAVEGDPHAARMVQGSRVLSAWAGPAVPPPPAPSPPVVPGS
jgi:hypothetical protein